MKQKPNSSGLNKSVHLEILAKLISTTPVLYFRVNYNGNQCGASPAYH